MGELNVYEEARSRGDNKKFVEAFAEIDNSSFFKSKRLFFSFQGQKLKIIIDGDNVIFEDKINKESINFHEFIRKPYDETFIKNDYTILEDNGITKNVFLIRIFENIKNGKSFI